MRTLLIEDDPTFARELSEFLGAHGCEVEWLASGTAALERLQTGQAPDLVLMDLILPGLDGWDLFHDLRSGGAASQVPVVVLSKVPHGRATAPLLDGIYARLQKPTGPASARLFFEELAELLERVRSELAADARVHA